MTNSKQPSTSDEQSASDLLTTAQVAAAYHLSQSTLRKWRCTGMGPRFTRIGRAVRYRRSELQNYLDGRTFVSTALADGGEA